MRKHVVVLYGGRSAEHEVSCRSAAFVLRNLDPQKYIVHAVGIDKHGNWWVQDLVHILENLGQTVPIEKSQEFKFTFDNGSNPIRALLQQILGLVSGDASVRSLDNCVVFPVIHGSNGEDGTLQGLVEIADVAFVGPDTKSSAIGMDKIVAKRLVKESGVNVVPWIDFRSELWLRDHHSVVKRVINELRFPVFVKPSRLGSSIGISKVKSKDTLVEAVENALNYDDRILIEQGLDVREIECAALGGYDPLVSIAGEVIAHEDFYSYEAKYLKKEAASVVVPANLDQHDLRLVQELTQKIFVALDLYGMARVDFFLNKANGSFYFNEVNTIPGFTEISQYPILWKASGVPGTMLLDRLIDLAFDRQKTKSKLAIHP